MTAPTPRPLGSPAAPVAGVAPVIPTPAAPPLPLSAPPRHRAEAETHHVHEVRLKKAGPVAAPSTSSGMPLKVAGSLALVVGIAGGFGYSTYKDLQSRGSETNLAQFDAATPSAAADAATNDFEEMTKEFRDQSVAALFQVPAESPATPVPAPMSPLPGTAPAPAADSGNPFEVQSEPLPAAKPAAAASSNPFEVQSEPAPAATLAAEPAKASTWATRDRRPGTLQRSAAPVKPLPANPRVAAKGDAVLFAPPIEGKATAPVPAEPILFPGQEEPTTRVSPKPFQRPITDGTAREAVTQIQFEEPAGGATPFAPAQPQAPAQDPGGFLAESPASAAPNLGSGPGAPVAPPAGASTVPTFDLGNSGPTPGSAVVSPPTFQAQGTPEPAPAMRRAPAPFAGRDDLHPVPAPEPAQPVGGASPFAPASQQLPAWPREEAAPADPFGAAAAAPPVARTPAVPRGDGQFTGEETVHTVEAGENYWTISRKHYGMGRYFVALAEFNKSRIPDPKLLKPGMKVVVPTAAALTEKYAHLISGAAPAKTYAPQTADASEAQTIQQVGFFVDRSGAPVYRVAEGDTLSDVAQTCLGRSSRWVQIYGLNRDQLKSPNDLKLGMLLRLPQDASGVQAAPEASVIR